MKKTITQRLIVLAACMVATYAVAQTTQAEITTTTITVTPPVTRTEPTHAFPTHKFEPTRSITQTEDRKPSISVSPHLFPTSIAETIAAKRAALCPTVLEQVKNRANNLV